MILSEPASTFRDHALTAPALRSNAVAVTLAGEVRMIRVSGRAAMLAGALLGLANLAGAPVAAETGASPRRVVSFNVCADQLLVALADPDQIAGLSPYASDPRVSVVAEQARKFRRLDWQAESILPLDPDLVLVGPWDRPETRQIL